MRRLLLLLSFSFILQSSFANAFDSLLQVSGAEQRNVLARKIYFGQEIDMSKESIDAATKQVQSMAKQLTDDRLAAFALVMQTDFYLRYDLGEEVLLAKNLDEIAEYTRQTADPILQIDYFHHLGLFRYRLQKFETAFEFMLKANTLMNKMGICSLPYSGVYLNDLALKYYSFFDYNKVAELISQSIACGHTTKRALIDSYNTLGLVKRELGNYDGALNYFQTARKEAMTLGDSAWYGIIAGNIGSTLFKMGKPEEALEYLKVDYQLSLKSKEWESAIGASMIMIDIYLYKNQLSLANGQMMALDTVFPNVSLQRIRYKYFTTKAAIDRRRNDFVAAYNSLDSARNYYQLYLNSNNAVITKIAEQKTQVENHLQDLQLLESQKRNQLIIRNSIITAAILLLIIAGQLIYRQKQKQKQHLLNIKNARYQLNTYIESLREKNGLIENFEREIEILQATSVYPIPSKTEEIKRKLQESTILTEDDWQDFKHLFEQVYKHFFEELREKHPGLTQAETRLIALSKLNLSKKEMAEMLGVSIDAIRKTRQRIRYKLLLPDEKSLEELLQTL